MLAWAGACIAVWEVLAIGDGFGTWYLGGLEGGDSKEQVCIWWIREL